MTDKRTTRELVLILLERSESHLRELQDQNLHLKEMNGAVADNSKDNASNKANIKNLWRVVGGFGLTLLAIITLVITLIRVSYGG